MTRAIVLVCFTALLALGCDEDPVPCEVGCVEADAGVSDPDAGTAAPCGADCDAVVVDAAWLVDHLSATDLAVLDTRGAAAFAEGHVPGALRIDEGPLRATVDGVGGQVAPMADLQAAFRAVGLARDDAVVVMGTDTTTGPARVFWTLEHVGHARVLFLDGGWTAYAAAGGPTETGEPDAPASDYTIDALDPNRRVDAAWVRDHLADPDVMLVDARSSGEFDAGRIANAVSVDWTRNLDGGALRARDDVLALYPGLDLATTTGVAYCQTGSRASVAYLVLRWLGVEDVRLYDGSWAEWGALDATEYPRDP